MAFHVACPITCRKICFCTMGSQRRLQSEKGMAEFLEEVGRVEKFLNDPWLIKARENATVQVMVPKVVVTPAPPPPPKFSAVGFGGGDGKEWGEESASAQVKRSALQKQAAAASIAAEDYARKFESGDLVDSVKDAAEEEQGQSNSKVMCRLCFSGEHEGSEKVSKMLPCSSCGKKYHRNCLKAWSQNRDLFHWSSWTCPSCRICEVCRRTGDPNKFMFCKRCDGAYHCYCQQPPHKNVGHGPYLCPTHTKCHSCGSSVPGNGLSVRWFLGYTCCDACGRLFTKGNYCPVCLKVYRDSESTPMVCCDICQRWVHCPCDGISDAKYMQFQADGNLQYVCPACRGECNQVRNLEEAVQELWRRKDEADRDLIASLRASVGLPTQEEIFDISPFTDDEENEPGISKNEYGRTLKFSLKGLGEKSPKMSKEHGKRSSNKKYGKKKGKETFLIRKTEAHQSSGQSNGPLFGYSSGDNKTEELQSYEEPDTSPFPLAGNKTSRTIKIKRSKTHSLSNREDVVNHSGTSNTTKGTKLVIHLGGRSGNITSPPRSEVSSFKKEQDLTSSNDCADQMKDSKLREKGGHLIKIKNTSSESSPPLDTRALLGKRSNEDRASAVSGSEVPASKRNKYSSLKYSGDGQTVSGNLIDDDSNIPSFSQSAPKDLKSRMKIKISNNSNNGNQDSLAVHGKDEITYVKGQRSKRRRPAMFEDKTPITGDDDPVNEFLDANWILQKLGKDAAGKRVEIHQPSNDSWNRGTVVEVFEGTSIVSIVLDHGKAQNFELGKQRIRFVSQKQKH
ncbi:transcription factor HALR MLL3, involved in embryonic development [Olea europaea subsp. europaea]|uniref:Transcription factor HALR MLL3, involved in embryonic development n=2 Tax=Olea europaea subsp. europaea TaxID=158383 RepID=A0A8S0RNK6_OLEEU|nr:transcription factor HALR MLL3, involved in embryonic development [Olea europaea subsp. europaea]